VLIAIILIVFVLVWIGAAKLAFELKQSATISIGGGFLCTVIAFAMITDLLGFRDENSQTSIRRPVEVRSAETTTGTKQVMTDADYHRVESKVAFRLAGIAFVGSVIILIVLGGLLQFTGLTGAVGALGFGMTFLQLLLGVHHYARAENWSDQTISYLTYGFILLFISFGVWAKLQER
jgi:hypothetical protein